VTGDGATLTKLLGASPEGRGAILRNAANYIRMGRRSSAHLILEHLDVGQNAAPRNCPAIGQYLDHAASEGFLQPHRARVVADSVGEQRKGELGVSWIDAEAPCEGRRVPTQVGPKREGKPLPLFTNGHLVARRLAGVEALNEAMYPGRHRYPLLTLDLSNATF
jgi:hypothetical protein